MIVAIAKNDQIVCEKCGQKFYTNMQTNYANLDASDKAFQDALFDNLNHVIFCGGKREQS